jgi:hypothetical protein
MYGSAGWDVMNWKETQFLTSSQASAHVFRSTCGRCLIWCPTQSPGWYVFHGTTHEAAVQRVKWENLREIRTEIECFFASNARNRRTTLATARIATLLFNLIQGENTLGSHPPMWLTSNGNLAKIHWKCRPGSMIRSWSLRLATTKNSGCYQALDAVTYQASLPGETTWSNEAHNSRCFRFRWSARRWLPASFPSSHTCASHRRDQDRAPESFARSLSEARGFTRAWMTSCKMFRAIAIQL